MQLLRRHPAASGAGSRGRRRGDFRVLVASVLIGIALATGGPAWAKRRQRPHPRATAPAAAAPPAEIDPAQGCRSNPALVAPCFEIEGRAFRAAGTPRLRLQDTRSHKTLAVLPSEAEIVPVCLQDLLQPGVEVRGRFLVCPFTPPARRQMQMVCVQEASQLTAARWDPATQQQVPLGDAQACALEAPVTE